jgi:hypothetical protein
VGSGLYLCRLVGFLVLVATVEEFGSHRARACIPTKYHDMLHVPERATYLHSPLIVIVTFSIVPIGLIAVESNLHRIRRVDPFR